MSFAWPHLLWLLLLPAAWLAWDLSRQRRGATTGLHPKIAMAEAGARHVSLARPHATSGRARPWLCLGLVFAVLALARPQWGRLDEPVFDQAREILIAMDLSRSMLTPDVKPSRLERAKLLTQSLLEKLSGERVGLVVFSGTAFLQSPLSADYEILREFLPALGPDFLPEGGTNYRALIDTALAAFSSTTAADRFLIILSDGEATEDNWRDRIDELKAKGVRVIALGVGTTAGGMIPDGSGGLVKDDRGAVVLSKLESSTLRELAEKTGGTYQDASTWVDLAAVIQATVNAGRKGQFTEKNTVRLVERFQWPLAFALWCLLVSVYYELPVRPKPREVKLRTGPADQEPAPARPAAARPAATAAGLGLLLLLAGPSLAGSARAQTPSPTPPAAPPPAPVLSQIVGRLAVADERSARDWSEFGHETVTWGTRLQSSQQPVPEGPVRDALAATDLGEKLDAQATDWPKLRAELTALLQKPEKQKQQQQQKQDQQNQKDQQQNQQNQDQKEQKDQQKEQQQKQQDQRKQPQDSSQQKPQDQGQPKPQNQPKEEQPSAFGDMKDKPPPPPPQDMQKVGGVPEKKPAEPPPSDPALALPLQKLQQLRNNDSPAELFKLMEAEKDQKPHKTTKDW